MVTAIQNFNNAFSGSNFFNEEISWLLPAVKIFYKSNAGLIIDDFDRNNIELNNFPFMELLQKCMSSFLHMPELFKIHCFFRISETFAPPAFHFNEMKNIFRSCNNVYFKPAG